MPSTPTPRLRAELQALGENLNTWGDGRLNAALTRLEEAIADVVPIAITGTAYVLTSTNYVADEARGAALVITGTLTGNTTVTAPTVEKLYLIDNRTTQGAYSLTIKTAAGTGYALRPGPQWVFCDGSDFVRGGPRLDQVPVPTAPVDMNAQRLTNLSTPANNSDAATKRYVDDTAFSAAGGNLPGQTGNSGRLLSTDGTVAGWGPRANDLKRAFWGGTAGGTANALTATTGESLTGLVAGQVIGVMVGATGNSGAATLSVDGLGAIAIRKNGAALAGGELAANTDAWFQYTGAYFRLLSGGGAVSFPSIGQKTSAYAVVAADAGKLIPCSGSWTMTLPAANTLSNGFTITVKNTGTTGTISVAPAGADVVDGFPSGALAPGQSVMLTCDGTQWFSTGATGFTSTGAWSPTAKSTTATLSNSGLTATFATTNQWRSLRSGSVVPSGKYYWEVLCFSATDGSMTIGVVDSSFSSWETQMFGPAFYRADGNKQQNSSGTTTYGASWAAGDVIGIALDTASGEIWFRKNGAWQASGDPASGANPAFTGLSGTLYPAAGTFNNAAFIGRFKAADLSGSIPSGFSTLP